MRIVVLTFTVTIALLCATSDGPPRERRVWRDPIPVTIPTPPIVETVTRIVTGPSSARPACPPGRRDAPFALHPPRLPEPVTAIAPAPSNAGWIVAWNDEHAYASVDAGATFARVLDGPGTLRAATFDCYGRAIVLRGDRRIGIRDGATESWHAVDDVSPQGLLGGGPDVVLVGDVPGDSWQARVGISHDAGATWELRDLDRANAIVGFEPNMPYAGRQHEDGTIDVAVALADCERDLLLWAKISGDEIKLDVSGTSPGAQLQLYGDVEIANNQWRRFGGEWQTIDVPVELDGPLAGPSPAMMSGNEVYRVDDGIVRRLPVVVQGAAATMDAAGRVWFLACGQPMIAGHEVVDLAGQGCGSDI
jgi:hypothetical protein